ncbi:MAG: HlyC/CorC family transporter [Gemmatimonadetes bacterium]|nr:HlyC/CorC family transporter [Gemmatimonadota bacterium]MBI3567047.1 HlyC/CorC family transporter [Gemmatimonadota bacterium]
MLARISLIVVLLVLNGYFVAVEFALVRSRRTRLLAMVRAGDPIAHFALSASGNLARVLSASQLGITLASLGLGWAAESALGHALDGVLAVLPMAIEQSLRVSIGAMVALLAITYLHVVFGELAPRAIALAQPEVAAKWLAPPLLAFAWLAKPFISVLHASATLVVRALGQRTDVGHEAVHSPDELRMLVEQSEEQGALESSDAELIDAVFEFSEKNAREVMTPRTEMVSLDVDASLDAAVETVDEAGFSRYPVYDDTIDNIVGMVHAKDLLRVLHRRTPGDAFSLRTILRRVHFVPGSREVEDVLADFKRLKEHLAIVLDEYGGTAGLVTMEDLLEEIVGEILDEYDEGVAPQPVTAKSGELIVPGAMDIDELNEAYGLAVPEHGYTTVGGYVFGLLGRLPAVGDRVNGGGASFVVRAMDGRRIESVAVEKDKAK